MRIIVVLAILSACVRMPKLPPVPRGRELQAQTAVAIEALCELKDHDAGDPFTFWVRVGSGVMIDGRHALTALHIVGCPTIPTVRATFANGKTRRMVVEREWRDLDVARLVIASAEMLSIAPAVIAPAPPPGESVCAAHTIPARGWACGLVESVSSKGDGNVDISADIHSGNSGAGVYDLHGSLIGIVVQRLKHGVGGSATSIAGRL